MKTEMSAIVLAAGKGTRLRTEGCDLPKVMRLADGKPLLRYVLHGLDFVPVENTVIVVGYKKDEVIKGFPEYRFAVQEEQLGTGHAVMSAEQALAGFSGPVLVCCGDMPLITGETYRAMAETWETSGAACVILTGTADEYLPYGRIVRDENGDFVRMVEEKDCTEEQKKITELNSGVYVFDCRKLFGALHRIRNDNAQGEYYLTDVLAKLRAMGKKVGGVVTADSEMIMGVNSRRQLAEAESVMRRRILERLMDEGVTVMDPASTFIEKSVKISPDTTIYPYTWLQGETVIGEDCEIGPCVRMENVKVADGCRCGFTHMHDCEVK